MFNLKNCMFYTTIKESNTCFNVIPYKSTVTILYIFTVLSLGNVIWSYVISYFLSLQSSDNVYDDKPSFILSILAVNFINSWSFEPRQMLTEPSHLKSLQTGVCTNNSTVLFQFKLINPCYPKKSLVTSGCMGWRMILNASRTRDTHGYFTRSVHSSDT